MNRPLRAQRIAAGSVLVLLLSCSAAAPKGGVNAARAGQTQRPAPDSPHDRYTWQPSTRSPQPLEGVAGETAPCGGSDRALLRVAERIAAREAAGERPLDTAEITFALRSEGSPYVWPRAWTLDGALDEALERDKVAAWLDELDRDGQRRCAVVTLDAAGGRRTLSAVAATVLADLEPLPTRVAVGTWLDVRARLLVPASGVEVVVLGPRGRPHAVLASLTGTRARARFRADREGTWLVQVLAQTGSGPRLAAEAIVAAGSELPDSYDEVAAPGETLAGGARNAADAVLSMVNAARSGEGLGLLRRDGALDRLALEQAEGMRAKRALSHGASGTTLDERLAPLNLRAAGENVAHAADLARAHRALWRSPSHRENLLHPAFELVGVGVAPDEDGSVWVCELFATPGR